MKSGQKEACDYFAVLLGKEISEIVPGYISTEVDARLSFDTSLFISYITDIAQQLELELVVEAVESDTVAELLSQLNVTLMIRKYIGSVVIPTKQRN